MALWTGLDEQKVADLANEMLQYASTPLIKGPNHFKDLFLNSSTYAETPEENIMNNIESLSLASTSSAREHLEELGIQIPANEHIGQFRTNVEVNELQYQGREMRIPMPQTMTVTVTSKDPNGCIYERDYARVDEQEWVMVEERKEFQFGGSSQTSYAPPSGPIDWSPDPHFIAFAAQGKGIRMWVKATHQHFLTHSVMMFLDELMDLKRNKLIKCRYFDPKDMEKANELMIKAIFDYTLVDSEYLKVLNVSGLVPGNDGSVTLPDYSQYKR